MAYRTNSPPSDAPLTRRTLLQLFGLTGTALLVACGSPTANSTGGAAPAPTTAAPAAVSLPPFKGIPQGRTTDGFPFLGAADAPVTLIDYSDFL